MADIPAQDKFIRTWEVGGGHVVDTLDNQDLKIVILHSRERKTMN